MLDGSRAADVALADVAVPHSALLGGNEHADDAVAAVIHGAIAALSADAVGAIAAMVKATVDYTKTRVQFGQPLAHFQALQHRMVRMKINEEEARATSLFATLSVDAPAQAGPAPSAAPRPRSAVAPASSIRRRSSCTAPSARPWSCRSEPMPSASSPMRSLFGSTREHLRRYGDIIADPTCRRRRDRVSGSEISNR